MPAVARAAEGSFRDSLSILEQVLAFTDGALTAEAVHAAIGGKALLKGNKILSPLSDEPELVLRIVRELVPPEAELGHRVLRPADIRARL